jgi:diacylglycerol kinase family enzyme
LAQGSRPQLDTGRLGIIVLDRPGDKHAPVTAWSTPSIEIAATTPLSAGLDGEAVILLPPLHCTTRPSALPVRISRHHPGASPSALLSSR